MSIASELQNYANGLDDAYDAVSDMSGIIPQDKNMNNLDAAIRTIPVGGATPNDGVLTIEQNGVMVQTFSANQSTNATANIKTITGFVWSLTPTPGLYKDLTLSEVATFLDVSTAFSSGSVEIYDADSGEFTAKAITLDIVNSAVKLFPTFGKTIVTLTYDENTGWAWSSETLQSSLTAGSNISISNNTISATDTTYSDFTGATSSVAGAHGLVPAPAAGDQGKVLHGDGTWKDTTAKLVEMSYGESNAWAKFIAAYNAGSIVYCRASSNSNPGTGAKTRKAFMAYVNNETTPTSVEFQYVRSQSSKTDSQQCDQVFVYTLTNASGGTWSVASRNMAPKINVNGPITKTFTSGANATITIGADTMTGATSSAAGAAGVVPAPAAGDENKVLRGDGTWVAQNEPIVAWLDWFSIEVDLEGQGTATGQFMDNYTSATAVGSSFFAGAVSDNKQVIIRTGGGLPVPGTDWADEIVRPVQVKYIAGALNDATIYFWHENMFVRAECSGSSTTWTFTKLSV